MEIINDTGIPTSEFDNLKREYQITLKRLVQEKYSDLFNSLPLSDVNQTRLMNYFDNPVDTAEYQAKLFLWFCQQSDISLIKKDAEQEKTTVEETSHENIEHKTVGTASHENEKNKREREWHKAKQKKPNLLSLSIIGSISIVGIVILFWIFPLVAPLMSIENVTATMYSPATAPTSYPNFLATQTAYAAVTPTFTYPDFLATQTAFVAKHPVEITDSKGVKMESVPAGNFIMGNDNSYPNESPVHEVYLDTFYMDKFEVTNASYKVCVNSKACEPPQDKSSETRPNYYGNSEFDNYPVIYVDWNQAKAYCEWRDASLPTEAQWEKSARSTDGRLYPWGEGRGNDCNKANFCKGDTTEVGSYEDGKSPYGIYDLAGNVWEWTADWYSVTYYQKSIFSNPKGPNTGLYKVRRSGTWSVYGYLKPVSIREPNDPNAASQYLGFRCARSTP